MPLLLNLRHTILFEDQSRYRYKIINKYFFGMWLIFGCFRSKGVDSLVDASSCNFSFLHLNHHHRNACHLAICAALSIFVFTLVKCWLWVSWYVLAIGNNCLNSNLSIQMCAWIRVNSVSPMHLLPMWASPMRTYLLPVWAPPTWAYCKPPMWLPSTWVKFMCLHHQLPVWATMYPAIHSLCHLLQWLCLNML